MSQNRPNHVAVCHVHQDRLDLLTRSQFASISWLQMTGGENILALLPRPVFFILLCATARLTLLDNTTVLSSFYLYQFYTLIYIYQFITSILMSFSFTFAHPLVSGNVEEYHTLKSKNKLVYMLKFLMLFFPLTFACVFIEA